MSGHVLPSKPSSPTSKSSSSSELPDPQVLLLALAAAYATPRLLASFVNIALDIAEAPLPGWFDTILSVLLVAMNAAAVACVALLGALDSRGNPALRLAAAGALGLALVWSWALHLALPDSLVPDFPLARTLLFGVPRIVATLLFAHWIAGLLQAERRQPLIAVVCWWGACCSLFKGVFGGGYPAFVVVEVVVVVVVLAEILRLRSALATR